MVVIPFFFLNDTATTEIYTNLNTLSLHDALPILYLVQGTSFDTSCASICMRLCRPSDAHLDRKSTRLNSSHIQISYAVFCLKKKSRGERLPPEQLERVHLQGRRFWKEGHSYGGR